MDKIIIEQTGIKQQVINEICELAQKYNVEQVLLFGSRSRGDYKRTSDIDLAVRGGDIDRFALDVEEETAQTKRRCTPVEKASRLFGKPSEAASPDRKRIRCAHPAPTPYAPTIG